MKLPHPPPPLQSLLTSLPPEVLPRVFQAQPGPLVRGAYLHWDELRHQDPPEGLNHEQWWFGLRWARQGNAQPLPLLDAQGRPFVFGTPEPLQIHLHYIDQDAAGEIRASSPVATPALRDDYLLRSLIEESITSSQLEGASTTRRVAAAMLREGRRPKGHNEQMIYNNFRTMQAIQAMREAPLTPERVLELHRLLTEDTLQDPTEVGRFRRSDDVRVVDTEDGVILHQPPPYVELPERLERLCAFANADEDARPFVHPVLRAILLHFMIGYDHPFTEGNGRTARALFYWSMLRSKYWLAEFISISSMLRRAPARYGRAYLHTESDGGDTTYFLLHQAETIRKAIASLHDYLARKTREQQSVERLLATSPFLRAKLNHRQRVLLAHALKHPGEGYRVEGHQRSHGVVYQTARTDLLTLADLGLLEKLKEGRAFLFVAPADLEARLSGLEGP